MVNELNLFLVRTCRFRVDSVWYQSKCSSDFTVLVQEVPIKPMFLKWVFSCLHHIHWEIIYWKVILNNKCERSCLHREYHSQYKYWVSFYAATKSFPPEISFLVQLKLNCKNIYWVKQFHSGEGKCIKLLLGYFSQFLSSLFWGVWGRSVSSRPV